MISARKAAHEAGEKTYIGKPCPRGHTKRYTCNCSCVECDKAYDRATQEVNNAWQRWWRSTHLERAREASCERQRRFRSRHPYYYRGRYDDVAAHRRAIQINTLRAIYGTLL